MKETTLTKKYVFNGKVVNMRTDTAVTDDGMEVYREVVEHPGGVGIALEDEEGRFFMVKQYRYAQETEMTEFPAGKKEAGEDPFMTAQREIVEETGYEGTDWVYLGKTIPTPAYDTETIDLYYAKTGKFVGQHFDEDERIDTCRMTLQEIIDACYKGEIQDAKTMSMAFLIREMKERKHE